MLAARQEDEVAVEAVEDKLERLHKQADVRQPQLQKKNQVANETPHSCYRTSVLLPKALSYDLLWRKI